MFLAAHDDLVRTQEHVGWISLTLPMPLALMNWPASNHSGSNTGCNDAVCVSTISMPATASRAFPTGSTGSPINSLPFSESFAVFRVATKNMKRLDGTHARNPAQNIVRIARRPNKADALRVRFGEVLGCYSDNGAGP